MITEIYVKQLVNMAKQLDNTLGKACDFQDLVQAITNEHNERAILELIRSLGILTKSKTLPGMEEKQEKMVEVLYKYLGALKVDHLVQNLKDSAQVPLERLFNELDALVGLDEVKQQVRDLIGYNQIQHLRIDKGLKKSDRTLHMAFLGNPGTAKTTVARIVGKMFKSLGFLSKGHFIEVGRTDLIAEYQGQTAIKVKKLIQRARGGVLFIDEAYSITENEQSDSYGKEGLTELTKALEEFRDDLVVIVAGYPDLMNNFFESNPGLKSRFNTFFLFEDYSVDQLVQIFNYISDQNDYIIGHQAIEKVYDLLQLKVNDKDEYFSNGRLVRNLFDNVTMNQSRRLSKLNNSLNKESLMLITEEDIPVTLYEYQVSN